MYHRAADEKNDAEAKNVLIRLYSEVADEERVLLYAKRLAEEHNQPAQLIKCLVRGIGTAVDLDAARRLGWDGVSQFESEDDDDDDDVDDVDDDDNDDEDQNALSGQTPQVTSLRAKREKEDELVAEDKKRAKLEVVAAAPAPSSASATKQSPSAAAVASPVKRFSFGANSVNNVGSPIRFLASSPKVDVSAYRKSSEGQMTEWGIDEVVRHFIQLGCEEGETAELRKQKIDGFALTCISDWRVLFSDLKIPMGVCLKHEAFMKMAKK